MSRGTKCCNGMQVVYLRMDEEKMLNNAADMPTII